ncbi:MAG: 2-oxoglutarate dehydrogenase complex dihydrolipoyllysine-residue succinyltransferase [Ferruginibacter sp.]|nr:2-oxoglutarate dehydrogenase complex dihydrolipoyllysine-residue succinyltransferase [Cytophagales bacterium]
MPLDIKVPSVGESVTEVTVAAWNKKEGDFVNRDEVLCELESDKATFELPAEASGTLHIIARPGDTLPIGAVLGSLEENGSAGKEPPSAAQVIQPQPEQNKQPVEKPAPTTPAAPTTAAVVEMKVPSVGESVTEVTIASWNKKDGDPVNRDEVLCELESDKATFELPAEASGTLRIVAQQGETLPIGALICRIEVGAAGNEPVSPPPAVAQPATQLTAQPTEENKTSYATGYPSPAAGKILAEKGIATKQVNGTGVEGRITKTDALKATVSNQPPAVSGKSVDPKPTEKPDGDRPPAAQTGKSEVSPPTAMAGSPRSQRRQKLTPLRKTVARRLVAVKNETAMLTTFNEVDMKPIMELRTKYKDKFKEKYGVGLGFMSFFAKAVCLALQEWPAVNATIDGDEIVYNDFCDISIAVSAPKGLVVPVIRNAESMSFAQIEAEVVRLATKARDNKLTIEEMTGGTFTITNGGVFGSMLSTPIINAPQSAILGMHNILERPVAINGQVEIRPMMYVALSYDHRLIDGRESVSFLVRVKQLLEDPTRLLLGI